MAILGALAGVAKAVTDAAKKQQSSGTTASAPKSTNYPSNVGAPKTTNTPTSTSGGTYNIGSETGQLVANGLQVGGTYKASDGSVWTKNKDGSISVTEKSGKVTSNAYQSSVPQVQQPLTPTTYYAEDTSKYIQEQLEQKYAAAQKQALAQSAYAVDKGTSDIQYQLQQQLPSYQAMREQSAANTQTDLDNLALRSALQGNKGGIGERQYGVLQASGQDRLLQINLEQKNLENTAAKQIADLEAQGRFQDAQTVASLAQSKINDLITEAQNLRNINIQQEQFNKNFGLQQANLTGYYGGNRTLSGQQFDFSKDTTLADLTGTYNGQQTLAGKQLDFQMDQAQRDWAATLLGYGYTDAQLAQAMGIPLSAAQQIRNNLVAAKVPTGGSSGGSSGSRSSGSGGSRGSSSGSIDLSTQAGVNALYQKIADSGMTASLWLRNNGSKYGLKTTEGSIADFAAGYEEWLDSKSSSSTVPKAPDTSNSDIVNHNSAGNWVNIGGVRYSTSEVEKMIDNGKVGLRQLASGKYEYYFK